MARIIRSRVLIPIALALLFAGLSAGQEALDLQALQRIRREGLENSRVMEFLGYLSDVHGPRLPATPQYRRAGEWVVEELRRIGVEDARLEAYGTFGRGWELEKVYAAMTSPQYMPLIAYAKAWTPGTAGVITGAPVLVDARTAADLEKHKGKLQGAIVLTQGEQELPISFDPAASRLSDDALRNLALAPEPGARVLGAPRMQELMARQQFQQALQKFLRDEGAAALIEPGRGRNGTVYVQSGGSHMTGALTPLPQVVVSAEQYNRIARILGRGVPVEMEIEVAARFHDEDLQGYNVIGDVPGTDSKLRDQIVLLGGHFDTWHGGTGATDNGAGCAVAYEALRILQAAGLRPRRTVRIGLWDAEEQGFVGSRGYVTKHFFDRVKKEKKLAYDKLSVYFNFDNGSGRIRGIYAQGNVAAVPIFREWLAPLRDLGAETVTARNTGGTDHLSFDGVGLPGFQFIQDELEYDTLTHHSNMDVLDHASEADLMQAATVMAWFVYNAAMRDEMMPRKFFDPNAPPVRRR